MHTSYFALLTPIAASLFAAFPLSSIAQTRLPEVRVEGQRETPLNNDARADSASTLGLTPRETPATVEVIDRAMMESRGLRSVSEAMQGTVGVTAGDHPAEPASFSMRGFSSSQINTLYNGIKIGPQNMTSRVMDTGNLERIEVLKGPASLMSGEGAAGGAVNLVTRKPHRGPVENEAYISFGSFSTLRAGFGSGGSTPVQGLDYRFDVSRSSSNGFIDDTGSRNWHVSGGLDYQVSSNFKLWGAVEYKKDSASAYWGTPLVPAAFSGANAAGGIVSGTYVSNYNGTNLGPITIDGRTLKTNYNVLDNRNTAEEYFLRGGFEWILGGGLTMRDQVYYYTAKREWFNNEITAFNTGSGLIDRERFYVAHDQSLIGNKAEVQWDAKLSGMDNRMVAVLDVSSLNFDRPGAANFPGDTVPVVNPSRGTYGLLTTQKQTADIRNVALSVEDRLKLTPALALIAGLRHETIDLDRGSTNVAGANRAGFPFSTSFHPTTGRVGVTYEAMPGFTLYGQYATGADVAANNLFLLGATQPLQLTRARTYEVGAKHLFWEKKAEWNFALFDIERRNVYAAQGGQSLNIAGKQLSKGAELSLAVKPTRAWNLWGNVAYTEAKYADYTFAGGSFSGNKPPNVPNVVANAGVSYRFNTPMPVEIGASVRHVGDRFHSDANTVKLLAYTVGDAFASMDVGKTKLSFRVRNITNEKYAIWSDPFYPDQILLGAPRSYEVTALFKF
jgi:iron complex outermembrane receptor protein